MRRTLAVVLLAVVLAAAGCSDDEGATAPVTSATSDPTVTGGSDTTAAIAVGPTFTPPPLDWDSCGEGLECATLVAPLDHDDPAGPTVDVAVARLPARDPDRRIGAVLVNPGGPGASGIDFIEGGPPLPDLDERFDVVAWDPRGVGASEPLACGGSVAELRTLDPGPDDPGEQSALDAAAVAVAEDCSGEGAAAGDLSAHLDSTVAARDLDLLRQAMGEEQVSFLGYSYGTLIGLEYLRAFPDRVRAMALDGVVDPAQSLPELLRDQTDAVDEVVRDGLAACAANGECALDDPLGAYDELADRVERTPLPSDDGADVGPGRLAFAAIAATYRDDGLVRLGAALADGVEADGTALARLADSYAIDDDGFAAYVATLCVDGPHPTGAAEAVAFAAELEARSPRFGAAIANEVLPCAFWPDPPGRQPAPLSSDARIPPVLVVGTTGDAATPFAAAERVAASLPGSALLIYAGLGHTASTGDACVADAVIDHLVTLLLPPTGSVCRP